MIYGTRATLAGQMKAQGVTCNYCQQTEPQQISVYSRYAHIMWIPIFPFGKKAVNECTHCKRTTERSDWPNALQSQYDLRRKEVKTPKWHFLGLGLIGLLSILIGISDMTREIDPRSEMLDADIESMVNDPSTVGDTVSTTIKTFIGDFLSEDMNVDRIKYLHKVRDGKALTAVKLPELKDFDKESRQALMDVVVQLVELEPSLEPYEKYYALYGSVTPLVIKTPTVEHNSRVPDYGALYQFYGEK